MILTDTLNPIAFHLFHWPIYWYGIMYLVGILGGFLLLRLRLKDHHLTEETLSDLMFAVTLGIILGGRIGYMLFYNTQALLQDPAVLFKIWQGGMSFHGGLIGVLLALYLVAKKTHRPWLSLTDFIAPVVPLGLAAGRLGNFINGELWGRATDGTWGVIFPMAGPLPRHPSQLYELCLEGVLLFIILWRFSAHVRPLGRVSGLFALLYGVFRMAAECFREPDAQIGYWWHYFTEGQLLSLPLIIVGIWLLMRKVRG